MSEAAPITVFIVLIDNFLIHGPVKVGAVYWNEQAALEEVARLKAANRRTHARVIDRQLDWPSFLQPSRIGQEPVSGYQYPSEDE